MNPSRPLCAKVGSHAVAPRPWPLSSRYEVGNRPRAVRRVVTDFFKFASVGLCFRTRFMFRSFAWPRPLSRSLGVARKASRRRPSRQGRRRDAQTDCPWFARIPSRLALCLARHSYRPRSKRGLTGARGIRVTVVPLASVVAAIVV